VNKILRLTDVGPCIPTIFFTHEASGLLI
jgi:hypothetical protein